LVFSGGIHVNRRSSLSTRSLIAAALLSAAGIVVAHDAYAAPGDAAAQKLDKEAMDSDYLNVAFDKAKSKLDKAIKECGSDCSKETQVKLQLHLGIILANMGKPAEAKDAFVAALKLDGKAEPEKDFTSPDVQKAFDEAKKSAPAASEDPPKDEKKPKKPAGDDEDGDVKGDLRHEAVTEHQSSVPLPIWASGEGVGKMVLHYKPFGGDWTKLEMKKMGKGFGAEIPCKDTSTSGTLQYYITAQDSAGDSAGANGSKRDPYKVTVKQKISGDLAHFPDKDPPAKCAAECPPGLPGCTTARLGYGSKCTGPGQCESGLACIEGTCSPGDENKTDEPGDTGEIAPKNFFSFNLIGDIALVSGSDLCSKQNQIDGAYTCFKSNDKQYAGDPPAGKGGALEGFAQFGTMRVTLGYDRRVASNFLVGVRLGYAFRGGPQADGGNAFLPFHAELRGTYYIGKDALTKVGLRPYVFLSGGAAQVDAKIPNVVVRNDCQQRAGDANISADCVKPLPNDKNASPNNIDVDAWKRLGQAFVGGGVGAVYAINKKGGVSVEVKAAGYFPSSGFAVSPAIGYVQGF
jgi:tetratricopeptide (TPR) repeat protein